jgi:hypothetical protein
LFAYIKLQSTEIAVYFISAHGIATIYVASVQIKSKHLENQKPIDV